MTEPKAQPHPLTRLWQRGRAFRGRAILGVVFSVLNKIFDIAPELLIGVAIDVVVRSKDSFISQIFGAAGREDQLLILASITALVWILESLTEYLAARVWRELSQDVQHQLRIDAYSHVQDLDLQWFEDRASGRLQTVLSDDVNQLERFLDVGANKIILTATNIVAVGAVFVVISPMLALTAFLPIPVIVIGSLLFQKRLAPLYEGVRERAGAVGGLIGGNLGGIATIKAFGGQERETQRIAIASEAYAQANRDAIKFSSGFVPLIRMAVLAGFVMTLVFGGHAAINGDLELGLYSVLIFMTQRLLWPLTDLGETLDLYQRGTASLKRILDLIDTPIQINSGETVLPGGTPGAVKFEQVGFSYRSDQPVLKNVDFEVPAGHTHAIVGPTGAGKSTIVKLLLRLYEADSGTVSIDGVPIRELQLESLRGSIGYVGQDAFLFDGTVAENLRYGAPGASLQQLKHAAAQAEAAEFIEALPQGYDTQIGERGVKLSGGQRQRLTIARAIVREPAILVLDEATSAVDNETEAAIQRSLRRLSLERTTIVIAHRLSTIRHAEKIHVIADGEIVESGTHEELVAAKRRYASLWSVQTGEVMD